MLMLGIMSFSSIAYIISILGIVAIAAMALLRRRQKVFLVFSLFAMGLAGWLLSQFILESSHSVRLWLGFSFIFSEILAPAFLVFAFLYPNKNNIPYIVKTVAFFPLALFGPLSFSALLLKSFTTGPNGLNLSVGILYTFQTLVILAYLLGGCLVLLYRIRVMAESEKNQVYLLFLSVVIPLVVVGLTGLIFVNNDQLQPLRPFSILTMMMLIGYGMMYKGLFDIKSFVVRSAIYLVSTISLTIVYVAPAVYVVAIVIMGFPFVLYKFIFGVIVGSVLAVNYQRFQSRFNNITSKLFFRDDYDSANLLGRLNRQLVSSIDLDTMLHQSSDLLVSTIKSDFCVFVMNEINGVKRRTSGTSNIRLDNTDVDMMQLAMQRSGQDFIVVDNLPEVHDKLRYKLAGKNIALIINLAQKADSEESLGYIVLGFKKSGNYYNTRDISTLESAADVLVISIQNALHFEEIQKFNLTLQQKVDTATIQLRRTNAKLEALDETKDDFISMASHQLRTPLTSVKGYLSMVIDGDAGDVTPMQKKMLNQAFMSSQRMVFLIADLLNVSRLKTGKFVIEPVALDLSEMITQEIGQLRETAKLKSIELKYVRPKKYPQLMLDETKTRQVIMNFIDNAIHYTLAGGHITIELIDKPQSAELRVRDDGIGVPKNEQHHLFTKFYRAINARRERPDGTGLGLFMAKKVVVAQGGAVLFESKEGVGSMFGFTLPKEKLLVK